MRGLLLLALGLAAVGCGKAPEEVMGDTAPRTDSPPLQGKPSPKLVGVWELRSGGKSTLTLNADGSSRIVAEANSPGGKMKSDFASEWVENDGKLSMRRKGPDGKEFTSEYIYKLDPSGNEMKLSLEGRKAVQTFAKVKPK
ncbi:hypothetical protein [Fimbriimonas ginsengisoli]|uniref:Lipocalin-like domain-containing protein n=1 Tax=Fimbriimonas ginsengisoli Gsoil 348 TaxID=661478 RepID=A0A068NT67_FIMGI|nr:hypothetical protein [Fimbriimonas ginsengisoli]AIE84824.1 hypothetical protein OP10G_1456 [Fimbriimonas ginsengisoli Gsoil 348]